jgi:hypothetical protein
MKIRLGLLVAILLLVSHTALPEIEKVGRVCGNGICPAWWPKLEPVKGWHHEDEASFANNAGCPTHSRFRMCGRTEH